MELRTSGPQAASRDSTPVCPQGLLPGWCNSKSPRSRWLGRVQPWVWHHLEINQNSAIPIVNLWWVALGLWAGLGMVSLWLVRLGWHSPDGLCWEAGLGRVQLLCAVSEDECLKCSAGALHLAGWSSGPLVPRWLGRAGPNCGAAWTLPLLTHILWVGIIVFFILSHLFSLLQDNLFY